MSEAATNTEPLNVTQALTLAKSKLEAFTVTLVGEVSQVNNKSGYKAVYFSVKDENSSLDALMWLNRYREAGVDLRPGMLVQLTGKFTVYPKKGRMNFDVFTLSLAGEGDLRQKVAQLAKKLQDEGLMDPARKRALPEFPECIGLVTSPRGAAVHDVLRTLRRRYPLAQVLLAGVPVEGKNAPNDLVDGIVAVVEAGAEVVCLVRGGGSFEDLMPFNDERLARTISRCPVPVVTGIGHEPDTSIADMVADLRASTPTAAAEALSPDVAELDASFAALAATMMRRNDDYLSQLSSRLDAIASRPVLSDAHNILAADELSLDMAHDKLSRFGTTLFDEQGAALETRSQRIAQAGKNLVGPYEFGINAATDRMRIAGQGLLEPYSMALAGSAARLEDLSPLSAIARGYSIVKDEEGRIVRSVKDVSPGDPVIAMLSDGYLRAETVSTELADIEITTWKEES